MSDEKTIYDGSEDSGLNFEEEAEKLGSGNWFKPEQGTTKIEFLDNGLEDTREYENETREVVVFRVSVDGEEKLWTVNKAKSESSLYGQVIRLGADRGGLVGETVTLIRNGTGTDTQYTVQEAADL